MSRLSTGRPGWAAQEDVEGMDEWEQALRQRFGAWPRGWGRQRTAGREWTPALDMFDKGDRLLLRVELPGVPQEAIDVTLHQGVLTIRGERQPDEETQADEWLCCERAYGNFYRAVQLPAEVDGSKISAEYQNGVLTLTLPKQEKRQPHKIQVKGS